MPDQADPESPAAWLTDKIVSMKQTPDFASRHDGIAFVPGRSDPYLRLQFVSIFVRDQERTLRFFLDQLGFSLISDARFESGRRWIEVAPPDGTGSLALVVPTPGLDEEFLIGHSGLVTFLTEDVEAKYREWSDRGVKFTVPPQTPHWGGTFCRFEDPDGNPFVLAGFDEMTRQIEARRIAHAERLEAERRAAQELEIAKQVQARLFPQRQPPVPTLDYAGVCVQARSVGGDYYDFLDLGSNRVALVLGDIAGKGMAAALLMANLQASLRSQCVSAVDHPEQFLGSVNRQLFQSTGASAYATLFFADYDALTGLIRYANCGHLPALLLHRDGSFDRLETTCTVLGMFEDWECRLAKSRLAPGDVLALYTDGVTESFNAAQEEFGEQRLVDALRANCKLPAQALASAIVDEVIRFGGREQFDDITLIVAKTIGDPDHPPC